MRPILSMVFINNESEYKKSLLDENDLVEKTLLSSNGFIKEIDLMNYGVRISSGEYVCCILSGDKLPNDFFEHIISAAGSRRDAILFPSVNKVGVIKKFTTINRKWSFTGDNFVLGVQYFHPVKRRLIKHVMFTDEYGRDYLSFYSKQMSNVIFSEFQIKNITIKSDSV